MTTLNSEQGLHKPPLDRKWSFPTSVQWGEILSELLNSYFIHVYPPAFSLDTFYEIHPFPTMIVKEIKMAVKYVN